MKPVLTNKNVLGAALKIAGERLTSCVRMLSSTFLCRVRFLLGPSSQPYYRRDREDFWSGPDDTTKHWSLDESPAYPGALFVAGLKPVKTYRYAGQYEKPKLMDFNQNIIKLTSDFINDGTHSTYEVNWKDHERHMAGTSIHAASARLKA